MSNYKDKSEYREVNVRKLPKDANLISSHRFFPAKGDGESEILKLKGRLVPHVNRDKEKSFMRNDSTTVKFPVIRALSSAAAILQFSLGKIDISGSFVQSGPFNRNTYVCLPRSWTIKGFFLRKLVFPAYGLVESSRLWKLAIKDLLSDNGLECVSGMRQLFLKRNTSVNLLFIVAKVVEDFLLQGNPQVIQNFHDALSTL